MKKTTYVVAMGLFALTTLAGCFEIEDPSPAQEFANLKAAVQGKWSVDQISFRLCREASCNTTYYTGTTQDYFEFKADSAVLVYRDNQDILQKSSFKADYSRRDAIILSSDTWTGNFLIQEAGPNKLVLKSEFSGRDPAAVFTDTYYLVR